MSKKKSDISKEMIFRVADLFFSKEKKVREIADIVNKEFHPDPTLSRESIYPILAMAKSAEIVRLVPPVEKRLAQEVTEKFRLDLNDPDDLQVVSLPDQTSNETVAEFAAVTAMKMIEELSKRGSRTVTLGLGPGRASRDFSLYLAQLLRSATSTIRLNLVGIGAGCPTRSPQYAPVSFFNLFPDDRIVERFGLFASPMVKAGDFDALKATPGVAEVFDQLKVIDLVVTAMGDIRDEHDLLRIFLQQQGRDIDALIQAGWIGNVHYRPFGSKGPIIERKNEERAVTLFDLEDFRQMSEKKNRAVLLIARKCGLCEMTRARALRPLLTVPELKVWSAIVMDAATARELLKMDGP